MLVPVGVLDDHLHLGIDRLGRLEHEVLRHLAHGVEAILRPGAFALGGDVRIGLAGVEEEVIEDDLIEMAGGQFHRLLAFGAVIGVGVGEGAELPALAAGGERDAGGDGDAFGGECLLDGLDGLLLEELAVAVEFEVDLVELELTCDAGELLLEDLGVGQFSAVAHHDVDGDREVPVFALRRRGRRRSTHDRMLHEVKA